MWELEMQIEAVKSLPRPCLLLNLPRELRDQVWLHAVSFQFPVYQCKTPPKESITQIFLVNRQLEREAAPIFYRANNISLPIIFRYNSFWQNTSHFEKYLESDLYIPQRYRSHLRSVTIMANEYYFHEDHERFLPNHAARRSFDMRMQRLINFLDLRIRCLTRLTHGWIGYGLSSRGTRLAFQLKVHGDVQRVALQPIAPYWTGYSDIEFDPLEQKSVDAYNADLHDQDGNNRQARQLVTSSL